ncbi:MAG TPA: nucleoside triphosphate pyrophosphohydrolase [Candidatus Paceibacterota bacterium]
MTNYNKLVRDKIPHNIKVKGSSYKIKKLKQKDFEWELLKKVGEEASGLLAAKTKEEIVSELADILAVIEEIKKHKKISQRQILKAIKTNFERKGGFKKKIFLIWSSDDDYKTNERKYAKIKS